MKLSIHTITSIFLTALTVTTLFSCNKTSENTALLEAIPTVQAFKEDSLPEADITKIVNAGVNAQSAMNFQPWHFTVVTNKELMEDISFKLRKEFAKMSSSNFPAGDDLPPAPKSKRADVGDSPLMIIVSAKDGSDFDAGLAMQAIVAEATVLGYGTKILSSTTIVLNGKEKEEYKNILGIPEDMSAVAVVLIGKPKTDAVSGASSRKSKDEVITFIR